MLVRLDRLFRPGLRLVRVLAELAQGPALVQQIPALVELEEVEDKIAKTNAARAFDYPYLLPSRIPASTNI